MPESQPLRMSPLGHLYRSARRSLLRATDPGRELTDYEDLLPVVVEEVQRLAEDLRDVAAAEVGPSISWIGAAASMDLEEVIIQLDLDSFVDNDPRRVFDYADWYATPMALAARAYRRECGWDFAPDESGVWLLSVAPYRAVGFTAETHFEGVLNGFVILQDCDNDGQHEEIAHIWTATNWRRRGVGSRLIETALSRFPVSRVAGPLTDAGGRLMSEKASHLL